MHGLSDDESEQALHLQAVKDKELDHLRAKCDAATARSLAFCSGYKWVVKGLMRGGEGGGGEMSDADALDTVQLTQRLDAEVVAQAHRHCLKLLSPGSKCHFRFIDAAIYHCDF